MSRRDLARNAAAAVLLCSTPSGVEAAALKAIGNAVAGAYRVSDPGSSSLLPGPGSLQVTAGAAASDVAEPYAMQVDVEGIGIARYGSLGGRAHAEASSLPASSFAAGGEVLIDVGFTDAAVVRSDTLAPGTPVTLHFRTTLDATALHFIDPPAGNPPDSTGAAARLEVVIKDLDDVTRPFGQSALLLNSRGDHETLGGIDFDTAIGGRIELVADLFVAAGVQVDHPLYAFTSGTADVLADHTAELAYEPSGDIRLEADSGHEYAVPEPSRALLLATSVLLVLLRSRGRLRARV
jgi:hypothetical protein